MSENHTDHATQQLVQAAIKAAQNAYVPYSNFPVGAALRTTDGTVYTGCNVENAAYPATICAERTALVKAVSEGDRTFDALAVTTNSGGFPCGICRQMLYEFAPDLRVIVAMPDGQVLYDLPLNELLAHGFGPKELAPDASR
ncbi:MAG: cytidine deaminase [Anaerolineaceae bacterium]|nr:cytidine deaminase [Anaerolineaceae bacterium]